MRARRRRAPETASNSDPHLELSHEYIVYNNDACLGKDAPSLSPGCHAQRRGEISEPNLDYGANTATVVCAVQDHKGNYPTINTWSDIASRYVDKGVTFVGVARDTDPAQVGKYIKFIGDHDPRLGRMAFGCSVASGSRRWLQVNMGIKTAAEMKTSASIMRS